VTIANNYIDPSALDLTSIREIVIKNNKNNNPGGTLFVTVDALQSASKTKNITNYIDSFIKINFNQYNKNIKVIYTPPTHIDGAITNNSLYKNLFLKNQSINEGPNNDRNGIFDIALQENNFNFKIHFKQIPIMNVLFNYQTQGPRTFWKMTVNHYFSLNNNNLFDSDLLGNQNGNCTISSIVNPALFSNSIGLRRSVNIGVPNINSEYISSYKSCNDFFKSIWHYSIVNNLINNTNSSLVKFLNPPDINNYNVITYPSGSKVYYNNKNMSGRNYHNMATDKDIIVSIDRISCNISSIFNPNSILILYNRRTNENENFYFRKCNPQFNQINSINYGNALEDMSQENNFGKVKRINSKKNCKEIEYLRTFF
jgi:hypothetical protein